MGVLFLTSQNEKRYIRQFILYAVGQIKLLGIYISPFPLLQGIHLLLCASLTSVLDKPRICNI